MILVILGTALSISGIALMRNNDSTLGALGGVLLIVGIYLIIKGRKQFHTEK